MTGDQYLGLYQERGSVVRIKRVEKTVEKKRVFHTEIIESEVPVWHPGTWVFIPGHYQDKTYFVPETTVTKTRIVTGHYEERTETTLAHWGTREYWLEPHIEIEYRFVGTSEQRSGRAGWELVEGEYVFVGTEEQRSGRAGWESYEVEIPGCWQERRIWFPDVTRTLKTWVPDIEEEYEEVVPEHYETRNVWIEPWDKFMPQYMTMEKKMVEHTWATWEEVEVDQPVYEYIFEEFPEKYELIGVDRGVVWPEEFVKDTLTVRNLETGLQYDWQGEYLGLATRINANEYVVFEEEKH